MFYICTKFHENVLNGIRVMERTRKVNGRTDGPSDRRAAGQMDGQNLDTSLVTQIDLLSYATPEFLMENGEFIDLDFLIALLIYLNPLTHWICAKSGYSISISIIRNKIYVSSEK